MPSASATWLLATRVLAPMLTDWLRTVWEIAGWNCCCLALIAMGGTLAYSRAHTHGRALPAREDIAAGILFATVAHGGFAIIATAAWWCNEKHDRMHRAIVFATSMRDKGEVEGLVLVIIIVIATITSWTCMGVAWLLTWYALKDD